MAADALSDLLKTVRLTGAAYFEIVAREPWAVASPPRNLILPKILPDADHLIAYHVVTAGHCFATVGDGQPIALQAGQVLVVTNSDPHTMSSNPGLRADPPMPDVLEVAAAADKPFCINLGDGPASTNLVCGYLACDARPFNPLVESLPPVIKVGDPAHNGASWISQFIRFAVAEAAGKHAGSESVLTKLSELLFIDVVRCYLEVLPPERAGWLAGLRDPLIGKVISVECPQAWQSVRGVGYSLETAGGQRSTHANRLGKARIRERGTALAGSETCGGLRDAQRRRPCGG
jgi:Cupin